MPGEWVLDASVAAKCLFTEANSDAARTFVGASDAFAAPDFLFTELASIAVKKVRRGEAPEAFAVAALARAPQLLSNVSPTPPLVDRAFRLAAEHGFSVYDALYLVLAEERGGRVVTADAKLVARAATAGLSERVASLSSL